MSLIVLGINHQTGSVELRERLSFPEKDVPRALLDFKKQYSDAGIVLLSTCNRVELYLHDADREPAELSALARRFLAQWHGLLEEEFGEALYEYHGGDVARHLFRVAASLDSLVLGETQILGQVHDAYLIAQAEQSADKVIHALFQRAFSVAKAVRTKTAIGTGNVSISSVAVDLAASIFMDFSGKTVMIVGAGEMGELTVKSLVSKGVENVLIVNRSIEKAREMAELYNGEAAALDDLETHLHRADIVVASTAAPHAILLASHFERALEQRAQQPMFVFDIAVPRNVDARAGHLNNLYLYNIDDLRKTVEENMEERRQQAERATAIAERSAEEFAKWLHGIAAEPTIRSMANELDAIRRQELEKTLAALPGLTEKQCQEISYLTERIVHKILQSPMTQIKNEITHHDPHTVLHLVRRIFGIDE